MRPENTIPAFEYAIGAGVDVLELDMAVTKDDVLVVSHDPLLNPEICTGPGAPRAIRTLTLRELRQWDCGALRNPRFPKQTPIPGARRAAARSRGGGAAAARSRSDTGSGGSADRSRRIRSTTSVRKPTADPGPRSPPCPQPIGRHVTGSRIVNVDPAPGSPRTETEPPIASASSLTMARPSPEPTGRSAEYRPCR